EARRERALHALDQITHCLAAQSDPPADLDAAEVVSDSLSEATPGFTPPATPVADQDGEGPRFEELATTLRRISADDEAAAAALDRLPDVSMPLQATMFFFFAWAPTVTRQRQRSQHCSSLTLGRWPRHLLGRWPTMRAPRTARRTSRALAPDSTGTSTGPPPARAMRPLYPAKRRRRGRCACLPNTRTRALAGVPETAWVTLEAVDLVSRCPVPTLQDVPPFMRPAVRMALVTALSRIRNSASKPSIPDTTQLAHVEMFLLAPRMLSSHNRDSVCRPFLLPNCWSCFARRCDRRA
ncbi:unnamed protein product, partial [Symbiodinium microadriaticum]